MNKILISHRGNINGINSNMENNPIYIDKAIEQQYNVELDIWYSNSTLYLGHDNPQYLINLDWLLDRSAKIWIHCKNIESIEYFKNTNLHYFWHQNDDITLTSKGFLWTYPGKQITKYSIAVLPETIKKYDISNAYGICSDYIKNYKTK